VFSGFEGGFRGRWRKHRGRWAIFELSAVVEYHLRNLVQFRLQRDNVEWRGIIDVDTGRVELFRAKSKIHVDLNVRSPFAELELG
jgi:hypothetical protein